MNSKNSKKKRRVILCDYIIVSKIKRNFRNKAHSHGREINKYSLLTLQIQVCGLANTEKREKSG